MEQGTSTLGEAIPPVPAKLCECGCGELAPISPSNDLKRGYVKGEPRRFVAGHHRKLKLSVEVGQRFGRGVVVETFTLPRQGKRGGVISNARLRCDCGNEYVKTIYVLYNGSVKSCGCLLRSKGGYTPELVARNAVLNDYRNGARARGISWELEDDDFRRLVIMDCAYCGASPQRRVRSKGNSYLYNGVDRIDSSGPYRLGNVLPACHLCNRSKMDLSHEDWMAWVARLTSFHFFRPDTTPAGLLKPPA